MRDISDDLLNRYKNVVIMEIEQDGWYYCFRQIIPKLSLKSSLESTWKFTFVSVIPDVQFM